MGDLSDNFSESEFKCPCCGETKIKCKLIIALEELRSSIHKPIKILSGYRCERHNHEIGGARQSRHLISDASDIYVPGLSLMRLVMTALCVKAFENGGIGLYIPYKDGNRWRGNFLHVDVRPGAARWGDYKGQRIGFAQAMDLLKKYEENIEKAKKLLTGGK